MTNPNTIYIYNDEGAHPRSVQGCHDAVEKWTPYQANFIDAQALIHNNWAHAAALIIPGGADLPYCTKLNGAGNQRIRSYIEQGGAYIGICAGAYYASAMCDFHRGDKSEVLGARELAFYPGTAVGPTLAPYDAASESGMRTAQIQWHDGSMHQIYFNGGCHFPQPHEEVKILGYYTNKQQRLPDYGPNPLPAIIKCHVGAGKALLSGVHIEYESKELFREIIQLAISQHE